MVAARQRAERSRLVSLTALIAMSFSGEIENCDLDEFVETGHLDGGASAIPYDAKVEVYAKAIRDNNGVFLMPEEVAARGYFE